MKRDLSDVVPTCKQMISQFRYTWWSIRSYLFAIFTFNMASNSKKIYRSVEDVLQDVLDSDFEVDSGSEIGELSSEEEDLIDQGIDLEVDKEQQRYSMDDCERFPTIQIILCNHKNL